MEVSKRFEFSTFPTTTEDILEEFGDVEIEYPRGSDPLRAILERSGTRPINHGIYWR